MGQNVITWDQTGERNFETGVSKMVLYKQKTVDRSGKKTVIYDKGVAWNGISGVTESPSGGDENKIFADNMKYLSLYAAEDFGCTIEAYSSPEEFDECDGTSEIVPGVKIGQQTRVGFGFSFQTLLGNDVDSTNHGYIIHIVYNAKAQPSDRNYSTTNESPEAMNLSWTITTTAERPSTGDWNATAVVKIDSTKFDAEKLTKLEKILYGYTPDASESGETAYNPQLPSLDKLINFVKTGEYTPEPELVVSENGVG